MNDSAKNAYIDQICRLISELNHSTNLEKMILSDQSFSILINKFQALRNLLIGINEADLLICSLATLKYFFERLDKYSTGFIPKLIKYIQGNVRHPNSTNALIRDFDDIYQLLTQSIEQVNKDINQSNVTTEFEDEVARRRSELDNIFLEIEKKSQALEELEKRTTEKVEAIPNNIAEKVAFKPLLNAQIDYLRRQELKKIQISSLMSFIFMFLTFLTLLFYLVGGYEVVCEKVSAAGDAKNKELLKVVGADLYQKFTISSILISKIGIFILLTYMLYFFGRNFFAYRHNYIILQHRIRSMLVYEEFISQPHITSDTKNEITRHAGSAIFASSDTGFLKSSSEKINLTLPGILGVGHSSEK